MTPLQALEHSLALVVERVGDPAPLVYARLFAQSPELLPMFVGDALGSVRGEMFHRALDTLLDLAAGQPYAASMIAAEVRNHGMNGVSKPQFDSFFESIAQVCREALGDDWTPEIDAAWKTTLAGAAGITAGEASTA